MDFREATAENLSDERNHWWIKTRFLYLMSALKRTVQDKKNQQENDNITVFEFGCGTAQNLFYINEVSKNENVNLVGIDTSLPDDFSKKYSSQNLTLLKSLSSLKKPQEKTTPYNKDQCDLVLAMDVLEHVEDDQKTLNQWIKSLRPGGYILITVPAFKMLWSDHDTFLGHFRRYKKQEVDALASSCGLVKKESHYIFSYMFPLVYLIRTLLKKGNPKEEMKTPSLFLNSTLYIFGKVEKALGSFMPFGTSVVGIYQKPTS